MSPLPRTDVYTRVTAKIIADLEHGVSTWIKPWNAEHAAGRITRPLRHSGIPYRGVNVLLLWCEAEEKGFTAPFWMTFKQAQELGATVRKGEHGSLVVYADRFTKTETDDNGATLDREIPFMKGYTVFNVEQIDGLPVHYTAKAEDARAPMAGPEGGGAGRHLTRLVHARRCGEELAALIGLTPIAPATPKVCARSVATSSRSAAVAAPRGSCGAARVCDSAGRS